MKQINIKNSIGGGGVFNPLEIRFVNLLYRGVYDE